MKNRNYELSAVECFRLHSVPDEINDESIITSYSKKIFRNEPVVLSPFFIIGYCEAKSFNDTWEKYLDYVDKINFDSYKLETLDRHLAHSKANLRIAKATHIRETIEVNRSHLY